MNALHNQWLPLVLIINYKTDKWWQIENQFDDLQVAMSSDMTSLKQKQEIVLQKLLKANRTVRITDYTIMLNAYGVNNEWNGKLWKPWLQTAK